MPLIPMRTMLDHAAENNYGETKDNNNCYDPPSSRILVIKVGFHRLSFNSLKFFIFYDSIGKWSWCVK